MQSNQIILSLQKRQASAVVQLQQNYLTQKVASITNQKDLYALPHQVQSPSKQLQYTEPTVKPCSGHRYQDKTMKEHRISTEHRPFYPDGQQPAKHLRYSVHILSCASCCHQDISIHQTEYPATNHFKKCSNRKQQNSTKWGKKIQKQNRIHLPCLPSLQLDPLLMQHCQLLSRKP